MNELTAPPSTARRAAPDQPSGPAIVPALVALAVLTAGLAVVTGLNLSVPGRSAATFAVALTAPGTALVVWARLGDRVLAAVAAVIVSLSLVILVAQGMVLAAWWRPEAAMTVLLAASAASLVVRAARVRARGKASAHAG
jgi:hypothetical protein